MTTTTLPIQSKDYVPILPKPESRKLGGMGKIVHWIRNSRTEGMIYRVSVLSLAIISSMVLLASVVLSPIFIWGFKEFMIQEQEALFIPWRRNLRDCGMEQSQHQFIHGRIAPLENCRLYLSYSTRKRMVHDLELDQVLADTIDNRDLLKLASLKFDNYLERYNLMISSNSFLSNSIFFRVWPLNLLV